MTNSTFLNLTIYPHRSLSRNGFIILMFIFGSICLIGGTIFWFLGAWPVFGFFGLDVLLVYLAFKLNYKSGRIYEKILIASKKLVISRGFPSGKLQQWSLDPYWTKVELVKQNNNTQLIVSSGKKTVSIGSFLNKFDKKKLETKLKDSITNYKKTLNI